MSEPHVVIVTGMSGAGRSQVANVLEDVGYFVVDNLPTSLIEAVVDRVGVLEGARSKVAVVADTRGGITSDALDATLKGLMGRGVRVTVLYLDADDATLIRRYEETRRPHPVQEGPLGETIRAERAAFEEIRGQADFIIDTSDLNVHQLRQHVEAAFAGERPARRMRVDLMSFGFKRGVPRVVDLLFDVRFLPNPHWVAELRPQTGLDAEVSTYVLGQADAAEFLDRTSELLAFLVPRYEAEGKSYLTIGVGCTGGRHRSVAITEELAKRLGGEFADVNVVHRDLPEDAADSG
jgi:UPF0042 nucleotide-binding protein